MTAARPAGPVAAVVLHWRGVADTERCLRSLRAPGGPERVVVVRNGPGDGGGARLEEAFRGDPAVAFADLPENRGFAAGANAGVRRALADGAGSVLLLNHDAVLAPGALDALRGALAAEPGAAAAGPVILREEGDARPWFAGGRVVRALGLVVHEERWPAGAGPRAVPFLTFCAVLVPAASWERIGPLDEAFFAYGEDADWCLRAARRGAPLLLVPGARAVHRVGGSLGPGSPARAFLLARSRVLLARRHAGAAARALAFWPWNLLVRGPHDFLRTLLLHGGAAARAGLRGLLGAGGPLPPAVRAELGGGGAP